MNSLYFSPIPNIELNHKTENFRTISIAGTRYIIDFICDEEAKATRGLFLFGMNAIESKRMFLNQQ